MKRILTTTFLLLSMLPLTAFSQSGGGSVTVTSDPRGAQVKLTGNATVAGVTPTTFHQFLIGGFDLVVSKPGFETHKERVIIDPAKPLQFSVTLSPKTRLKAALRSTFLPGWGQHYTGQHTKAWLFHTLAVGSIVGYLIADHNFDIRYEKYTRALDDYDAAVESGAPRPELERLLDDLLVRQKAAFDHEDYRRIAIGAVVGTWTLSVLDALLFLPDHGADLSVAGVAIQPGAADTPLGLNLTYRF